MKRKTRNLIITESVMFVLLFSAVFYCQYFIGYNDVLTSLKTAISLCVPLFLFAAVYGTAILLRAKFFAGDYESPLKDNDNKGEAPDRVYGVLNQLK